MSIIYPINVPTKTVVNKVHIPPNIVLVKVYTNDGSDTNKDTVTPFIIEFVLKSTELISTPTTIQVINVDIKTVISKSFAKSRNKQ